MTTGATDAEHGRDRQRQEWDRVAAGWQKWWQAIETGAQHVNDRMLSLANVAPGQHVLDIATGIGEPAMSAASRVGPTGRVVATDISKRMIEIARTRATASGLTNIEFLVADAERLNFPDSSFDAILCRWGITSLPDHSALLFRIHRLLKPNGSFATSVWDEASRLPLTGIAIAVAQEMFGGAPVDSEPPRAPTTPDERLESRMIRAGFTAVRSERLNVILEFASTETFIEYVSDVSPAVAALLSDQPSDRRKQYQQRLAEELRPYAAADDRFRIQNVSISVVGRKSAINPTQA